MAPIPKRVGYKYARTAATCSNGLFYRSSEALSGEVQESALCISGIRRVDGVNVVQRTAHFAQLQEVAQFKHVAQFEHATPPQARSQRRRPAGLYSVSRLFTGDDGRLGRAAREKDLEQRTWMT